MGKRSLFRLKICSPRHRCFEQNGRRFKQSNRSLKMDSSRFSIPLVQDGSFSSDDRRMFDSICRELLMRLISLRLVNEEQERLLDSRWRIPEKCETNKKPNERAWWSELESLNPPQVVGAALMHLAIAVALVALFMTADLSCIPNSGPMAQFQPQIAENFI